MNTVLILAESCQVDDYQRMRQVQRETWAAAGVPGVRHFFFSGDEQRQNAELVGDTLYLPCSNDYFRMAWKTKLALDFFADAPETFIFRTNTTSYVCKKRLLERAQQLPTTKCYSGKSGLTYEIINGVSLKRTPYMHVDGGGIFWSRDCSEIIRAKVKDATDQHVDDGEFAIILKDVPIIEGDRVDYFDADPKISKLRDTFLYRCRHAPKRDTDKTIQAMRTVHAFKQRLRK